SDSIIDALGYSAGFAMAIIVVAFFRELIGTGALSWAGHSLQIIPSEYAIKLFSTNSGAFITLGLVVAGYTAIMEAVKAKKAAKEKLAENK
ncbi:MAG: Rnf-Nqr domain containing protein, partial [Bacillales bacterium]|nr:Rnf-Nqr domain containing protein [Bacillales bacterium]